jgi:hypothetical protein
MSETTDSSFIVYRWRPFARGGPRRVALVSASQAAGLSPARAPDLSVLLLRGFRFFLRSGTALGRLSAC